MGDVTAEDALRYALSRDILLLVAAVVGGGVLVGAGINLLGGGHYGVLPTILKNMAGLTAIAGGIGLEVGGGIGLLYKVISDATSA